MLRSTLVLTIALLVTRAAAMTSDPVYGYWLVENKRAVIKIGPCGEEACGNIVWLAEPFGGDGRPKTDINNPDPSMRHRTLCGLPLISELKRSMPGAWKDGAIYNGKDGSVYSVKIMTEGADMLEVRGFLGISLFGKSQIWQRVADDRGGCSRMPQPGTDR